MLKVIKDEICLINPENDVNYRIRLRRGLIYSFITFNITGKGVVASIYTGRLIEPTQHGVMIDSSTLCTKVMRELCLGTVDMIISYDAGNDNRVPLTIVYENRADNVIAWLVGNYKADVLDCWKLMTSQKLVFALKPGLPEKRIKIQTSDKEKLNAMNLFDGSADYVDNDDWRK